MMLRIVDKAASLPPVIGPETNRKIWDEAWKEYVEDARRLYQFGFRRVGNASFRIGSPLTPEERDEVDALIGDYGF